MPQVDAQLDADTKLFYLNAMHVLDESGIDYLVGGAYSLAHLAGVVRHTKDFDVFVRKGHELHALGALQNWGCRTELTFPHWLGKAYQRGGEAFVDVIFGSGNGLCPVDDDWFEHAVAGRVFDRDALLVPAEEIIWTKAFIQERERFDGADIAHLIWSQAETLDWNRLLRRFAGHEQVLLAHLLLFTYIYPGERRKVPQRIIVRLYEKVRAQPPATEKVCQGTFISREQYLMDLRDRGYVDARLEPRGPMQANEVLQWTAAIGNIK